MPEHVATVLSPLAVVGYGLAWLFIALPEVQAFRNRNRQVRQAGMTLWQSSLALFRVDGPCAHSAYDRGLTGVHEGEWSRTRR